MITTTTIEVQEHKVNGVTKIAATRKDKKQIDIYDFFQPYYKKGLRITKLNYVVDSGTLTASLKPN